MRHSPQWLSNHLSFEYGTSCSGTLSCYSLNSTCPPGAKFSLSGSEILSTHSSWALWKLRNTVNIIIDFQCLLKSIEHINRSEQLVYRLCVLISAKNGWYKVFLRRRASWTSSSSCQRLRWWQSADLVHVWSVFRALLDNWKVEHLLRCAAVQWEINLVCDGTSWNSLEYVWKVALILL